MSVKEIEQELIYDTAVVELTKIANNKSLLTHRRRQARQAQEMLDKIEKWRKVLKNGTNRKK